RETWNSGKVSDSDLPMFEGGVNRLKSAIIEETAPEGKYFGNEELNKTLGELFVPKAKTRIRVGKLSSNNLYQRDRILGALEGFPEDWQAYAKFPRIVQARRDKNP